MLSVTPPQAQPPTQSGASSSSSSSSPGKIVFLSEDLLTIRQAAAARRMGMSSSALSKRWRETMKGRKWPYRIHCKLEKEIKELLQQHKGPARPPDIERKLCILLDQRRENIQPAMIRL